MKEKFRSALGMLYIIYVMILVVILDKSVQLGLLGSNNFTTQIFEKINYTTEIGKGSILFFIIFFTMFFYITKSNIDEIITYEDDNIENKINQKLIVYKALVVLTIILGAYIIIASKNEDIFYTTIFLTIDSALIYYTKKGHFMSYMYNRQMQWYKQINSEDIHEDTHKWRRKRKFNGYVKVNSKHRYMHILEYIPTIIIAIIFIVPDVLPIRLFMGYILIMNIASIVECLFSLYTKTTGICTSVVENSSKGNHTYSIVVTDYENKTEKKFSVNQLLNICEMDKVEVVYGVFSKRCLLINNIVNKPRKKLRSTYFSLFIFLTIVTGMVIKSGVLDEGKYEEINYGNEETFNSENDYYENYNKNDSYGEYINDPDVVLSGQEILDLYQNTNKDILEYKIIEPNEYYVESTFNTFEHYEGMVARQIVGDKKYGQILYPYSYDSYLNDITIQKETAMYLISQVLPSDAVEERVLVNKSYGQECIVYSSSKGTFVVRMLRNQYFNNTEPYYNEDEIVDLKYFKLIE